MNNIDWNNKDNNWTIDNNIEKKKIKIDSKYIVYISIGIVGLLLLLLTIFIINNQPKYSIKSDQLQLVVGKKYKIEEKGKYQFKIDDSNIAQVYKNGTIKCLKEGTTNLTITDDKDIKVIILYVSNSNNK